MRDDILPALLDSIKLYADLPYRLYIADELPISSSKHNIYEQLTNEGHQVLLLDDEKPISVCTARNKLVSLLKSEKYVLRIDDDFHFTDKTKLSNLKRILDARPEIGAVSGVEIQGVDGKGILAGELSAQQGFFFYDESKQILFKEPVPVDKWHWRMQDEIRYAYADFTRNFLLIRRSVFNTVRWNEAIQLQGEHTDFMLRLKEKGWLLAFTPDSSHIHNEPKKSNINQNYLVNRNSMLGQIKMDNVYKNEWKILNFRKIEPFKDVTFKQLLKIINDYLLNNIKKIFNLTKK